MFLDDRKKKILEAIIDDYISTAEPIGSRSVARKHELGLSSATIRNEMADLEEMGYLAQPHTSAGRIPSDKGYRFYVNELMKASHLTMDEITSIKTAMDTKINELGQLLKQASLAMSKITKYASMASTPERKNSVLKAVQIVPVDRGKALVIVITKAGIIKNSLVKISDNVLPEYLIGISSIFNEKLSGLSIDQINMPLIREIELLIGSSHEVLLPILNGITECTNQIDDSEVFMEGMTNMLNYPEFSDVVKAREFLSLMDTKELLSKALREIKENSEKVSIQIGKENIVEEMRECSLITTTYTVGDMVIGTIGVIGPTRMEYSKVLAAMNFMKKKMSEEIERLVGKNSDDG